LYERNINPEDNVIDFGCGGGFLLANFKCRNKIGIEINPEARKIASSNGIETVSQVNEIPDAWADVIISCHALEHTNRPLDELIALYPKLKTKGKIIFVVPYERKAPFKQNDINQHLYTWSEMNLGNLFTKAGYKVIKVEEIHHRFPPYSHQLVRLLGERLFYGVSRIYGSLRRKMTQVRVVAEKP
jgi:SAM-dependent methyltransferase